VPSHAAVAETVGAARRLHKAWAAALVNATLRGFLREREQLLAALDTDPVSALAHPAWLLDELRAAWPQQWQAIAAANNVRPPMTLRVNPRHGDAAAWRTRLTTAGHPAATVAAAPSALQLDAPCDVKILPGFATGALSVQDAAAQLAAPLLAVRPGQRVLDACAAPGGKTCHLLESQPALAELVALDRSAERLERVRENLVRLGGTARLVAADAAEVDSWWDGKPFERILLDAPCSGSGVIRRHPDIKLLRRPEDLVHLAGEQQRLLRAVWPLLAPGGRLLYATCSVLPVENERQISHFLADYEEAEELPITAEWGHPRDHGRQILPGEAGMDGFFYALLQRPRAATGGTNGTVR
jgi:16S rRNA (cytosine967-C5)-methyltransferase